MEACLGKMEAMDLVPNPEEIESVTVCVKRSPKKRLLWR
jgi:hypothetical protein